MYRLEAIEDRINSVECENVLNKQKELTDTFDEEILLALYRDFEKHSCQQRIHGLINRPDVIDELAIVFRLIDKRLDDERNRQEKGIGTYLLAILMRNLLDSEQLWIKLVRIIGQPEHSTTLVDLNKVLKRMSVMKRLATVIQEYLQHLVQLGDDFFIDCDSIEDSRKRKFFASIEVSRMIVIINHLLTQPDTSAFFTERIFTTFELSPSFLSHLKLSMRNLNL